ncbi:hypothetical protein Fmac_019832 [Flemingia macrophylla]|uniref:Lipoxygenase n=1 Tax=Flemingia macrophylla TaxID=520843 RepID=A0ABD1M914_9FABA
MFGSVTGMLQKGHKIRGTVVLMQKNVLDYNTVADLTKGNVTGIIGSGLNVVGSTLDSLTAFLGRSVALQLISATNSDASGKGKVGKDTFLEGIITSLPTLGAGESAFNIHFEWDDSMGIPGAFYIKNYMQVEFFLKSLTLEDVPNHGTIRFVCNSWVYNNKLYKTPRIFFANHSYLPSKTPAPLAHYREEELKNLRGDGTGERKEYDRIYDYDVYNDLGNPDLNQNLARPILGGSSTHPYPRRGRTGRYPTRKDTNCEKPGEIYVPRDEKFGHLKSSDFLIYGIKSLSQFVLPAFQSAFDYNLTPNEFHSFQDVRDLYEGGIKLPTDVISTISPLPVIKELFRTDGEQVLKFPTPLVIRVSKSAWMTDEEFTREMIAGVNPCVIRGLQEFPPKSNLDPAIYGDQTSKITADVLDLDGCTVDEKSFLPSKYSVEMSSAVYKNWVFTDQALPEDLIRRGVAIKDPSAPHGLRLLIEDYPYAVDGLQIWDVTKTWVQEYVSLYYAKDDDVKNDSELQNWWKEAVEKGHEDLKDKPWWPKLQTLEELVEICTIIIWTASALHAAVNFGQYPYGGFILNRPTSSRRLLPEQGTAEYEEMVKSHQKAYLRTITSKFQTLIDLSVIEILSRHASDEVYLGQRENPHWTSDSKALQAFQKFGNKLKEIEEKLASKNNDASLANRVGPVQMPYTLLHPTSGEGLTFRGIPNSISI